MVTFCSWYLLYSLITRRRQPPSITLGGGSNDNRQSQVCPSQCWRTHVPRSSRCLAPRVVSSHVEGKLDPTDTLPRFRGLSVPSHFSPPSSHGYFASPRTASTLFGLKLSKEAFFSLLFFLFWIFCELNLDVYLNSIRLRFVSVFDNNSLERRQHKLKAGVRGTLSKKTAHIIHQINAVFFEKTILI